MKRIKAAYLFIFCLALSACTSTNRAVPKQQKCNGYAQYICQLIQAAKGQDLRKVKSLLTSKTVTFLNKLTRCVGEEKVWQTVVEIVARVPLPSCKVISQETNRVELQCEFVRPAKVVLKKEKSNWKVSLVDSSKLTQLFEVKSEKLCKELSGQKK